MNSSATDQVSETTPTPLVLGTSSWTFDGWREVFYPPQVARNDWLGYYARHFAGVEVNTTFYALPAPATLIRWVESVPDGFTFALKFPKAITHDALLADCEPQTRAFLDVVDALGPCVGPALLQLPPTLTRRSHGVVLARYLDDLAARLLRQPMANRLRVAVEVRSEDLMTEAFARFLHERGMSLALVDRAGTPDLFDLWRSVSQHAGFAFVRWIGDDRNGPSGDSELVAPRDTELSCWAGRLADLVHDGVAVYGFMHNPYEGHAPASVRRLIQALDVTGVSVAWSPPEKSGSEAEKTPQLRLL